MAKIEVSNADTFLAEYAPMFLYSQTHGLFWAKYAEGARKWEVYRNSKLIALIPKRDRNFLPHWALVDVINAKYGVKFNEETSIRGRLRPDYSVIYIHDLDNRIHTTYAERRFEKIKQRAIDLVYKYLPIKEGI